MQYFIFSDVHSNLEGLVACLRDYVIYGKPSERTKSRIVQVLKAEGRGVKRLVAAETGSEDTVICLGDIVGYGADPVKCLDMVLGVADYFIVGNHDLALVQNNYEGFSRQMKEQWKWTYEQLTGSKNQSLKSYLSQLADVSSIILQDFNSNGGGSKRKLRFTHGVPTKPQHFYYYHYDAHEVERFFKSQMFSEVVAFIGHSHVPAVVTRTQPGHLSKFSYQVIPMGPKNNREDSTECFNVSKEERVLVSVPSAGQPRDRFTQAGYVIYDSELQEVTFRRVPYDYERAARKILERRNDNWCATRLMEE